MNHDDIQMFNQKFRPLYEKISDNDFCKTFAAKKYRHSIQVLTIGCEIASRDEKLKKQSAEFRALGEKALLFHDVGRFMEIYKKYNDNVFADHSSWFSKKYDHGVLSYEMMKQEPTFDDPRILAALKHHGHMMEKYYADEEFQNIKDKKIKQQTDSILAWVRDADKLANFYIQRHENNLRKEPFFITMSEEVKQAPISRDVLSQFENHRVILTGSIKSYCDRLLCCLSWIYDFNYQASYQICSEQGYFDMLLDLLNEYNHDKALQKKIADKIHQYLAEKIR